MAHDLARAFGKVSMMYSGEDPWHGLGTRLDRPVSSREVIEAAGLNYIVELKQLQIVDGRLVQARRATIRTDTGEVLGIVGNGYIPVQNFHAFGFLDGIAAHGELQYHTAGALGKGERVWLLVSLPGQIQVKNSEDLVNKFLLLSNAHDGSAALRVLFTPIRVVCANTLSMALRQGRKDGVRIRHNGNLAAKIREAQQVLGLAHRFYDDAAEKINHLANVYPNSAQLASYFKSLYPDRDPTQDNTKVQQTRDELMRLFEEGRGHDMPQIKHTLWTAYNAVTELVDHRPVRGKDDREKSTNRLRSIWWGNGAKLKERAWDLALEMAA